MRKALLLISSAWTALGAALVPAGPAPAQTAAGAPVADSGPSRPLDAPADPRSRSEKFWLSDDWFDHGQLDVPVNHEVERREISFVNPADGTDVPAVLFRPKGGGRYPAVLFAHGRRGLDPLTERLPLGIAARGFVVLAPNAYAARFIEPMPVAHRPETELDMSAGLDALLRLPDVSTSKACIVSHTRGGYVALRMAVAQGLQDRGLACLVAYYPHWQDPGAPEPDQVYRHAGEVERLTLPTLVFMGEYEQYQRRRSIESAVAAMKATGRPVRLIIYPGVGRGFEFRSAEVRTFADDLAAKDAVHRAGAFIASHLAAAALRQSP
ncbi:MAG: dienelactone hydrolase family protein [Hyphomicrobiaceae bacterium]|nr:dienelactone hydrolase family protein [Hyphomicrobiaceae bacterium]